MTYIINFAPQGVTICRGHNELRDCINDNYRRGKQYLIENILPMHYIERFYIVYEWDIGIYTTEPIPNRKLYDYIDFLKSENANILNIYEHTNQTAYPQPFEVLIP